MEKKDKLIRVPGGLILMYHRISELQSDPFSLAVTPSNFEEHLDVLRKYWLPISLNELVTTIKSGKTPYNKVAITFDDGYADLLENAKPLLERFGIPATIFVVAGQIGGKREFMWDELERLLLTPGWLPEELNLSISGQVLNWKLNEWSNYEDAAYLKNSDWKFEDENIPSTRHKIFRDLYYHLKLAREEERLQILNEMLIWAGDEGQIRKTHKILTQDDIHNLAKDKEIHFGGHTISHSVLAELPATLQIEDIRGCKSYLENITGNVIDSFAYPYGGVNDFTADTISILKETGYSYACSTFDGFISAKSDLYQLPRLDVKDWDRETFTKNLMKSFGDQSSVRY